MDFQFFTVEDEGTMNGVEVVLAEWLLESVQSLNVLTLDKRYFEIAGSVECWLALHAKKATGSESGQWVESFKSLYATSASPGFPALRQYSSEAGEEKFPSGLRLEARTGSNGAETLFMERTEKRAPFENPGQEQLLLIEQSPLEEAWENAIGLP